MSVILSQREHQINLSTYHQRGTKKCHLKLEFLDMPFVPLDPKRVLKPTRKLRKLLKNMPKQPAPEQVHDLRTNTRRFEAILAAISPDSTRKEKSLLRELAAIRKRAGKVRDMDVLTDFAARITADGEDNCK